MRPVEYIHNAIPLAIPHSLSTSGEWSRYTMQYSLQPLPVSAQEVSGVEYIHNALPLTTSHILSTRV